MKKTFSLLLAILLVLALAACGGSAAPSASGVWDLTAFPESPFDADSVSAVYELAADGTGYVKMNLDGHVTYLPLTWTDAGISLDGGDPSSYTLEDGTLTVHTEDGDCVLTRSGDVSDRTPLAPGSYSLVRAVLNGVDRTEEVVQTVVTINEDGTGFSQNGDYFSDFTWDGYFFTFTADSSRYFYTFDGTTLTASLRDSELTFTLEK